MTASKYTIFNLSSTKYNCFKTQCRHPCIKLLQWNFNLMFYMQGFSDFWFENRDTVHFEWTMLWQMSSHMKAYRTTCVEMFPQPADGGNRILILHNIHWARRLLHSHKNSGRIQKTKGRDWLWCKWTGIGERMNWVSMINREPYRVKVKHKTWIQLES